MWNRIKRFVQNTALVGVGLIAALAIAEAIARLYYAPSPKTITAFSLSQSDYYQRDSDQGWLPRPNIQGVHNLEGSFESTFSTNSLGLRDQEHALAKPAGVKRIVAVGDSFAWGFGVNDGETYADVLERILSNVEVINLGVTGYDLNREIKYFESMGLRFDPDILLIGFVMNDIVDSAVMNRLAPAPLRVADPYRAPSDAPAVPTFRLVKQFLANNSAFFTLFRDATNTSKTLVDILVALGLKEPPGGLDAVDTNLMPALKVYPPELLSAFERRRSELLRIQGLCRSLGIELVIAVVPARQSVEARSFRQSIAYTTYYEDDFDLDKPYRLLREFARANGIRLISPLAAYREAAAAGAELYLRRDMHFSPTGHDLFAREIARFLRESGLI